MNQTNQTMDEYTLAAFMAGTLSPERREEVALYLSRNADARELLQMAYEALEASQAQDEEFELPQPAPLPAASSPSRVDRTPTALGRRVPGVTRFLALAVVVVAAGIGLRLSLGPPADALRSRQVDNVLDVSVRAESDGPILQWNALADAYQYRVVVWDPSAAEVVGRFETTDTRLSPNDPFMESIRPVTAASRSYTVRVDAFDVQNRLIQTSETVPMSW